MPLITAPPCVPATCFNCGQAMSPASGCWRCWACDVIESTASVPGARPAMFLWAGADDTLEWVAYTDHGATHRASPA